MIGNILATINMSEFYSDTIDWMLTPFRVHLGDYVWPSIFISTVAFVYVITKNLGAAVASLFLVFGLFGTTTDFIDFPEFRWFASIIAIAGLAGIILALFIRKHGG